MPLSPGTRLGPYEILAPIGAGGMGEVYQARDTRLGRIVALKVSKTEFSERFDREARAIAALNHSNICTLYDVGPNYLVMEYIEGTPLKGPLPLDQALQYAAQICDALDAAHRKGITHRDLKPANILVTKTGVKLLDFGLAKLHHDPATGRPGADDATVTMALTGKNEIVGTLYYMSPEQLQAQADGQKIDARSDIFSFGIVLYEMLTGERAFEGKSPASVIAAIMERPAPSIAEVAPPALDRVLKKCLAKDRDERWQSARDLKDELQWIASASGEATTVRAEDQRQRLLPWVAAVAVLAVAAAAGWYRSAQPAHPQLKPLARFDVDLGPDVSQNVGLGAGVILSPDGTRLVYVSRGKLFTRRLDQGAATELAGTEGAVMPFFSPDGKWVAFSTSRALMKISVDGGAPVTLNETRGGRGASWGEDGTIVVTLRGALGKFSSAGGAATPLTQLAPGEATHRWPQVLPGGKAALFTSHTSLNGYDGANLEVVSLSDGHRKVVQRGGTFGRYVAASDGTGYLVYINNGALFAVLFDLNAWEVRGTPVPVLEHVAYSPNVGFAQFDVSNTGRLVYRSGELGGSGRVTVQWLDSTGKTQPLLAKPDLYLRPRLSPDGQRLAIDIVEGTNQYIGIYEWQRDTMTRLGFDMKSLVGYPVWSPDGRHLVFAAQGGIVWTRSDGGGKSQALAQGRISANPFSFTPDGNRLAFDERDNGRVSIWTMPVNQDGSGLHGGNPEPFRQGASLEAVPMFSPDGHWLAYVSIESGTFQVYVRAFPDRGGKWQISNNGGGFPVWAKNGHELFFRSSDSRIMAASYTVKGDSFVPEKPRIWSEKPIADLGLTVATFDVAPDGKRVVALMPADTQEKQQSQNHVIFLENFADELRRKVPVK